MNTGSTEQSADAPKPGPSRSRQTRKVTGGQLACLAVAVLIVGLASLPYARWFGSSGKGEVVVYAAQDQAYAAPILKDFTWQTGIKVKPVYDSEAVKTVGLANRLLAESNRPQCDVFWGNEEMRTRQLLAAGVFQDTNSVAGFGFRSRRIVANTNKVRQYHSGSVLSLLALTNAVWRGKVALAYPMFGTTAAHFHALRQRWGTDGWERWCRALVDNEAFVVDGNSVVVNLVGRGEASIGLTDSDDIAAGQRQRFPIIALPITDETLLIPNTVAMVRKCPHPNEARRLFEYLRSRPVTEALIAAGALEGTHAGVRPHLKADWPGLLKNLDDTNERLKKIFLR